MITSMNGPLTHDKNINLGSIDVKNRILKYLYDNVKQDIKHEMIASVKDMNNIRDNEYIICPRFSGTRSWIIFITIGKNYYAVNFPKHNPRKKDLFIHPIDIGFHKEFYYGTIMEGIFFRMDEKKFLVIDEVYILADQNQLLKSKDDRLNNLSHYMTKHIRNNPNNHMYVSQFFQINKKSLKELHQKIKDDNKIIEVIFYPKIFGKKIYSYAIIAEDLVDNIIKTTQFRMQKTASPDVYNLLSITSGNKIDIAYIPDMETSKKCKQWFKDNKAKELIVKCQMNIEKKKWVPLELIEEDVENEDRSDDSDNSSDDSVDQESNEEIVEV